MGELMLAENESLTSRIENLVIRYEAISQIRDRRLFTDFLVNGYKATTLSSVSDRFFDDVVLAKVCLGMIITLYDDLADNPQYYNPKLLKKLYALNIGEYSFDVTTLTKEDHAIFELAVYLFSHLEQTIKSFGHYSSLSEILAFDIHHIFMANRYSEIMMINPSMRNLIESKTLGSYNMGMVAAGMIDLMASPSYEKSELGSIREFLIQGQRLGRIGNLVSTFYREIQEGDITNEILIGGKDPAHYKKTLMKEFNEGFLEIKKLDDVVTCVNLDSYIAGLSKLYSLHVSLEGII